MSDDFDGDGFGGDEIAVVGMAVRVPGADSIDKFWDNLRNGVESVRELSDAELLEAEVPSRLLEDPNFVRLAAPLDGAKDFDAALFGFSPRDAAIMDPQHRQFLETSWEALEDAGYDPTRYDGSIGVFGGSGHNVYMAYNLMSNPDLMESVGFFLMRHTSNDKDFLVTRVAYLLDLTGPAVNVQTACSTSLVAVHLGVQSLLNGESDMVLAGGVTIDMPLNQGYLYKEGEILSKDGHCRAFDSQASGTIFGSGVGVVVLKRLDDALADGDVVHSIIKGTAINNDGLNKVGYLAPSVDGQAAAVSEALAVGDVDPSTIGFIECHGTGTEIGDPIEVAALQQVFGAQADVGSCALGSVKTNIGHLDTAAGIVGFIKASLALQHKLIPPTVHFAEANPRLSIEGSPFYVNNVPVAWDSPNHARRAGVSSLGVGGTNAHVVLEEAPSFEPSDPASPWQLLPLSAKGPTAVGQAAEKLAQFLETSADTNLGDVSYTLRVGRQALDTRQFAVVQDTEDAVAVLRGTHPSRRVAGPASPKDRNVVFMFPGQGAQYPGMGRDLYEAEPVFREVVDECASVLMGLVGRDIRELLFPAPDVCEWAERELAQTANTQPAIFVIEYALAQLWMSWGIQPTAMIGHSIGEYVAATVAGVFELEDALEVVATRGRLMQDLPAGSMLSVQATPDAIEPLLTEDVSVAAHNGPEFCVVAGPSSSIEQLAIELEDAGMPGRPLLTSHAFHSSMMEPMLGPFRDVVARVPRSAPTIPYVSNVTGTWATAEETTDPEYWARHVRAGVAFADGVGTILATETDPVLLEVGPGQTLATFARAHPDTAEAAVVSSMRHPKSDAHEIESILTAVGQLWAAGAIDDWSAFDEGQTRRRVRLPTYAFQHQEFWVEPGEQAAGVKPVAGLGKRSDIADWFSMPVWEQTPMPNADDSTLGSRSWLVFADSSGLGVDLVSQLQSDGDVVVVERGSEFSADGFSCSVDPAKPAHYERLMTHLSEIGVEPDAIAYLWPVDSVSTPGLPLAIEEARVNCFDGMVHLVQAVASIVPDAPIDFWVVTRGMHQIVSEEGRNVLQALTHGPIGVMEREHPTLRSRSVDVDWVDGASEQRRSVARQIHAEFCHQPKEAQLAHRGISRWVRQHMPVRQSSAGDDATLIKNDGVYLITGGLGGVGLALARDLAESNKAKLVLVSRTPVPDDLIRWLADNPSGHQASTFRDLQSLIEGGADVTVVSADVTDLEQMQSAVREAVELHGRIDGVFHAAGGLDDQLISMKDLAQTDNVIGPKVEGTYVLEEALEGLDLDFLVLFSSVSAITTPVGQVDYVAANAFLDAYAQERNAQLPRTTLALGWGPWSDVGMTVRTAVDLGFTEDLRAGRPVSHPDLDRWILEDGADVFLARLSAKRTWALDEHRTSDGSPLMPGTGYLDIVRSAFLELHPDGACEFSDVMFLAPLILDSVDEVVVRITIDQGDESFVVSSTTGGTQREHARGTISRMAPADTVPVDVAALHARSTTRTVEHERYEHAQLSWGPRWDVLRSVSYGTNEAVATLELSSAFVDDYRHHPLHPAVLDLATAGAQDLITGFEASRDFFVPFSYGRLRHYRPLGPGQIVSHIVYRHPDDDDAAVFDITLLDQKGHVLAEVEAFTMRRAVGQISSGSGGLDEDLPPLLANLRAGIRSDEAMDALRRVVVAHPPSAVITITSQDLQALIAQAAVTSATSEDATGDNPGQLHDRPDLSTPFVEPSGETELAIAAVWEEMLGIKGVGLDDDFYELGGHSLLLTQVTTRVRRLVSTPVPLVKLFEAVTIRQVAAILEEFDGEAGGQVAEQPALARVSRSAHRVKLGSLSGSGASVGQDEGANSR